MSSEQMADLSAAREEALKEYEALKNLDQMYF
jgi:hypothetical protein